MFKLICTDLDGTIVENGYQVSDKSIETIKALKEAGIEVVVSTGRNYQSARKIADEMGLDAPIIACNGACIRIPQTEEMIHLDRMSQESVREIVASTEGVSAVCYTYGTDAIYIGEKTEKFKEMLSNIETYVKGNLPLEIHEDLDVIEAVHVHEKPLKLEIFIDDLKDYDRVYNKLCEMTTIEVSSTYGHLIEIVNKGVSKGDALKRIATYYDIDVEHIVGIGDNHNDIQMLSVAGLGIAMGNASDSVKTYANEITKSIQDDGFAHAMEHFVLKL